MVHLSTLPVHEAQAAERKLSCHLDGGVDGDTEIVTQCWILLVAAQAQTNVRNIYIFCGHIIYNKSVLHYDLAGFGLLLSMRKHGLR